MNDLENGDISRNPDEPKPLPLGVKGLGGWLIVVQIGLYLTIISLLVQIYRVNLPTFEPGAWNLLTSKDSGLYHVMWAPYIVFDAVYNIALFLFCFVILAMFYARKSILPKLMIIFYSAGLAGVIIDPILAYPIPLAREMSVDTALSDIIRNMVVCALWIPYFLKSERVQATFVK